MYSSATVQNSLFSQVIPTSNGTPRVIRDRASVHWHSNGDADVTAGVLLLLETRASAWKTTLYEYFLQQTFHP